MVLSFATVGTACARDGTRDEDTVATPALQDNTASSPSSFAAYPAEWEGQTMPPADSLVRRGACPFECCMYGEWWSDSAVPVFSVVRDTLQVAFTIPPRTVFRGDSGTVYVTSLRRVIPLDTLSSDVVQLPGVVFTPADTLYLLQSLGEGSFQVWVNGRSMDVPGFFDPSLYPGVPVRLEGEYRSEWWAHATLPDGREGWLRMDTAPLLHGVDACGGPVEMPGQ